MRKTWTCLVNLVIFFFSLEVSPLPRSPRWIRWLWESCVSLRRNSCTAEDQDDWSKYGPLRPKQMRTMHESQIDKDGESSQGFHPFCVIFFSYIFPLFIHRHSPLFKLRCIVVDVDNYTLGERQSCPTFRLWTFEAHSIRTARQTRSLAPLTTRTKMDPSTKMSSYQYVS